MKNLLFLSFFVLCSLSTTQAQFSLGVDGGVNINHLKFKGYLGNTNSRANYYLGIRPTYEISTKLSVGLGLQYSLKGYGFTGTADEENIRNAYLDVLPQVEFRPIDMLGIVGGLNVGYKHHLESKIDGKWKKNLFLTDVFDRPDIGLLIGFKVYLKQMYLTTHYNHGIKSISSFESSDFYGEPLKLLVYNRNFQIGFGYMFNL